MGSFSVPQTAIHTLIKNKASTSEICAYLVIAAFSDASGQSSTAGLKAIFTRLAVTRDTAQTLAKRLVALGLIYDCRPPHGQGSSARKEVRFQLEQFGEPRDEHAWFCMSLMLLSKNGSAACCPLSRLKSLKAACAYTFLWLHGQQDSFMMSVRLPLESSEAPCAAFVYDYELECEDATTGSREAGFAKAKKLVAYDVPEVCDFERSLAALMDNAFVYESIVVLDRPVLGAHDGPGLRLADDVSFQYTLWTPKKGAGQLMDVEQGLALNQKDTWEREDKERIFDESGHFQRTFYVASRSGMAVAVVGLIRLRYRVHNHRNLDVSDSWHRMMVSHRNYMAWMERVKLQFM